MSIRFNPIRDTLSAFVGLWQGGFSGLIGTAAKKFVKDDSSTVKKVGIGALSWLLGGWPAVFSFLIAGNGGRGDVQRGRGDITRNRYS